MTSDTTCTNSVEWYSSKDRIVLHNKYVTYHHKTNIIMFTILSAIKGGNTTSLAPLFY